jgi:hypothetical protein
MLLVTQSPPQINEGVGNENRMVVMIRRYFLILLIALPLALVSCGSGARFQVLKNELTVRQFQGNSAQTQSMAAVTGNAVNPGNTEVTNCVITVIFYDASKNKLGVATATKDSLGPGEVWNFSAQITGPDAWKASTYEIIPSTK